MSNLKRGRPVQTKPTAGTATDRVVKAWARRKRSPAELAKALKVSRQLASSALDKYLGDWREQL